MSEYNNERRKRAGEEEDGDRGESGGFGGQGGAVEFRDFVFVQEERKLSPEQEKQLLAQHNIANSSLIEKQKELRDQRENKKEGKTVGNQWGAGGMAQEAANFLKHPILGEAPEFDGIDPQVNLDPTINEADSEKKEELIYKNELRLDLNKQLRNSNTPKPSPY